MTNTQINKVANNKKVYHGDNFLFAGEKKRGLVKVCWNHQGFYFDQSIVARRTSLCCVLLLSLFVIKVLLSGGHRAGEEGKGWRRKPCKSLAGEKHIV